MLPDTACDNSNVSCDGSFFPRNIFFTGIRLYLYAALALGLPLFLPFRPGWMGWLLPLMVAVHAIAVIAAFIPNCQWFGPVITRFRTERREVWLTIDDGPNPEDTPRLLRLLKRFKARATFFVIGSEVTARPDLVRAVVDQGHEVANHSHTHPIPWFWCAPSWVVARQIDRANRAIQNATGQTPRWFRSPLGANNCFVHLAIRQRKQKLLGWSVRGFDGINRDPEKIVERLMRRIRPGAIILLHEGKRDARGGFINVLVLEKLLQRLTAAGYECVLPTAEMIGSRATDRACKSVPEISPQSG